MMQMGVIAFRSPTGEFIDDEPIFEECENGQEFEFNPLDEFICYIAERMGKELAG